jgi:hypothetical protein
VAAFIDNPDLAYAAFILSGTGMAAIFPLNSFQSYHIFSLNVKNCEHTIIDNDNEIVADPYHFGLLIMIMVRRLIHLL